ncbi:hypothetical protein IAE51_10355 [Lactococcus sp. S64]|jgi:hypothetical protein|uniref:hypothetical protein n=1 Tax=Lactococcus sp. S64 TaxID=2767459 RepID=UPI001902FDAE|nr:hypothetical protein [Lactococcus sp. S64]MBK0084298.1 hypothetical protein [Lactococcus sp. S64]
MTYKEDLERSKSILDIQQAYERECQRRFLLLQEMFPDDSARMMLSEHLAIWLAAEKYAVGKFGISDRHWIQEKI